MRSNVTFHCAKGSKYLNPNEPVFAWHICEQLKNPITARDCHWSRTSGSLKFLENIKDTHKKLKLD